MYINYEQLWSEFKTEMQATEGTLEDNKLDIGDILRIMETLEDEAKM